MILLSLFTSKTTPVLLSVKTGVPWRRFSRVPTCCLFVLLSLVSVFALGSSSLAGEGDFGEKDIAMPDNCIFLDRNAEVLRFLPDERGLRHLWIPGKDIPDIVKQAFIAAEDKHFYGHHGVDWPASLRALKDNILQGRIVSGASTITQQVVRLIYPRKRTYKDKLVEISRSGRLEGSLSKDEILEQYLNRVPLGNHILGIELASRVYFGKSASQLSVAEAAVLASLPKAPGKLDPFRTNRGNLIRRKNWVLKRMAEQGYLSEEGFKKAREETILFRKQKPFPMKAPHLVHLLMAKGENSPGIHTTTIDLALQRAVERILTSHRARLVSKGVKQAAAIVVHNPSMEVLAWVGSFSYSSRNKGFNNGAIARRSAGSTIKPFIYGMALDKGYTISSLLEDTLRKYRTPFGDFSPDNFDMKEYGPVTMRVALGNSLNISAIKMMEALDQETAYQLLGRMNLITDSRRGSDYYGLGLVVGNAEVSLEQLVAAFAMLANSGVYRPLKYFLESEEGSGDRIFSKEVAYILSDVLSDPSARMITFGGFHDVSFPFKVSLKTGTSTRYRDGWTVGYTPEYTVGVWVGNFEGTSAGRTTGALGAAPIFRDVMDLLHGNAHPSTTDRPVRVTTAEICGISGMKPGPDCHYVTRELFIKGTEPTETCLFHERERYYHELPSTFAGWVYEKDQKGFSGSYRLRGFSKNLEDVFQNDPVSDSLFKNLTGIRVRRDDRQEEQFGRPLVGREDRLHHYSIGDGIDERTDPSTDGQLSIIYPLRNDRFIFEKNRIAQMIRLEIVSHRPVEYVDWFVDGVHYTRVKPPYRTYWQLERGRHQIIAVTPFRKGDSIEILVE
jgi:penicillin-binding protein 1C